MAIARPRSVRPRAVRQRSVAMMEQRSVRPIYVHESKGKLRCGHGQIENCETIVCETESCEAELYEAKVC